MKKKFVGFGEILLRMSPHGYLRFSQADNFDLSYSGAEANMAVSLSYMGMPAEIVTKLPNSDIGRCASRAMAKYNVHTNHIAYGGERLGVYYLEKGASQRPSKIIYDRKHTAISEASPEDFDWDDIFKDAGWFHFTGITVALSSNLQEICKQACIAAKKHGVKVSCDLNYRKTLWTTEEAQRVMKPLMSYVDILFANEEDSANVLGISADNTDVTKGKLDIEGYKSLTNNLAKEYGFEIVAVTLRESVSASDNNWSAIMLKDGQHYLSKKYSMHIVDRVGGGDSFASGLIYGYLNNFEPQKMLEYAVGASCLKHSIEMDFNLSSPEEILKLIEGDGSGRVER